MQTQFFDQQPQDNSPPLLPGPSGAKRLFRYDGQLFEDPGPEYSVQDVLTFLAQTYPELTQGSWHSRTLPDGSEEITFVKVTGEKGAAVTAAQIAARLAEIEPVPLQATVLLDQIMDASAEEQLDAAALLTLSPHIEAALTQVERLVTDSRRILDRCLALKATPQPRVPLGF